LNLPKPTDEPVIKIPKAVADKIEPEPSPVPRVPLAPVQSVEDKATPPQTAEENMRKEGHALPQPEGNRWMKSDERAPVSFGEAWFGGWKYSFAGRASRREFWFRQISFVVEGLGVEFVAWLWSSMVDNPVPMLLVWFWLLAAMVPMFALFVRRLHDGGFSGWVGVVRPIAIVLIIMWVLIPSLNRLDLTGGLIPIHYGYGYEYATFQCANIAFWGGFLLSCIQGVVEIVFGVLPGTPGTNKYGPNPYAKTVSRTGADILPGTGVCQSCGRQLELGHKFCPKCGTPVADATGGESETKAEG
jgi:uncharacterized membrane protein YhaH (DUF805 family)